jgi:hypothetical protein
MNPVAILVLLLALALIVVGFKGHQDNVIAAVTGKPWKGSTLK